MSPDDKIMYAMTTRFSNEMMGTPGRRSSLARPPAGKISS
jgi:hypothetical protein